MTFPVFPLVVSKFKKGIGISTFLSRKCVPLNADVIFYGIVFPIDIIIILGLSLLVITVWNIGNVVSLYINEDHCDGNLSFHPYNYTHSTEKSPAEEATTWRTQSKVNCSEAYSYDCSLPAYRVLQPNSINHNTEKFQRSRKGAS